MEPVGEKATLGFAGHLLEHSVSPQCIERFSLIQQPVDGKVVDFVQSVIPDELSDDKKEYIILSLSCSVLRFQNYTRSTSALSKISRSRSRIIIRDLYGRSE